MKSCWLAEPKERPTFKELTTSLSQMLESIAGYTELIMALPKLKEDPVDPEPEKDTTEESDMNLSSQKIT